MIIMRKTPLWLNIIKIILIICFCVFAILPIYMTLIVSLTPYSNVLEAQLFPHYFETENFIDAFGLIWDNVLNSFFYAVCTTILVTVVAIPAAYVMARYYFLGRTVIQFLLILTQMLAGIVILPTLYKMFDAMNLLNSRASMILVMVAMNLALVETILYGYFRTLPIELDESAQIDGASYIQLLIHIICPASGPGIAVGAIFAFVNSYNEFVVPLFLLSDSKKYPITLTIYSLLTDTTIRWHIMAAASIIGIVPPVIIFTVFQKYIIGGVTNGAVKG